MGNIFEDIGEWLNETFLDTDNLEFDTDNLRTQAGRIRQYATELRQAQQELTTSIDGLRETWKTGAGKAFFEKYDKDWAKRLSSYFDLLDLLVNDLEFAAGKYEEIKV